MSEVKKLITEENLKVIRLSMDSLRNRQITDGSQHENAKIPKISVEDIDSLLFYLFGTKIDRLAH